MQNPLLAGVRSKLDRAQSHFEDLHLLIRDALTSKLDEKTATTDLDEERKTVTLRHPTVESLDPILPLSVGDCIHNLRSALDHLVFQLALLNGATNEDATKTSFPICLTDAEFKRKTGRFADLLGSAFTAIKDLQPNKTSDPADSSYLWLLSQLDIIDKHRILVVVMQKFKVTGFEGTINAAGVRFSDPVHTEWRPAEEGAELLTVDFSRAFTGPAAKVNMKITTATTVQFANTGLVCDGGIVEDVINACGGFVEKVVNDFGKQFFGE